MLFHRRLRETLLEAVPEELRGLFAKRRETRQCGILLHQLHKSYRRPCQIWSPHVRLVARRYSLTILSQCLRAASKPSLKSFRNSR